ncbi:MAG: hypothetical protein KatS3mg081_1146 [Gemmatimonadales bacterium]|nr:hypothetical protein HRbin33_00388 [bacterium HR33]GIW51791.1 MAG: hypothetical protein KatS3mg081_1146 [Gemmatimonadales bacterium]
MRSAVLEARAAVRRLEQEVGSTEAALAAEREQLLAAERRGRLAEGIGDRETVEVARRFAAKHSERVALLERKLRVQREELTLLQRELSEMVEELGRAEQRAGAGGDAASEDEELLRYRMERAAREALAQEQLEALKRRMGR